MVVIGTRNQQSDFSLHKDKKSHLIDLGKKGEARAKEYSANDKKFLAMLRK